MRRGGPALDVLLWLAIAALLAATAVRISKYGPLGLERPRTVLSNTDARGNEPLLVFLSEISRDVPEGSTFSLVPPSGRDPANWLDYLTTVGQMPGRRVIFASRFLPPAGQREIPRFVACYGGGLADPRFRLLRRLSEGTLYEAQR